MLAIVTLSYLSFLTPLSALWYRPRVSLSLQSRARGSLFVRVLRYTTRHDLTTALVSFRRQLVAVRNCPVRPNDNLTTIHSWDLMTAEALAGAEIRVFVHPRHRLAEPGLTVRRGELRFSIGVIESVAASPLLPHGLYYSVGVVYINKGAQEEFNAGGRDTRNGLASLWVKGVRNVSILIFIL